MKPSKSQLDDLLSYLPALETPGRMFGEAQGLEPETNQQAAKPRVNFAQDVELFLRCASQPWFTDFEYAQKKPQFWLEDPNFLASSSLEQTITALTYCIRTEPFSESFVNQCLQTGLIQSILRRMQTLRDQMASGEPPILLGAISGDVIGSVYEYQQSKTLIFPLFSARSRLTDDSVLTVAVADAILNGGNYAEKILAYGRRYPDSDYGGSFIKWLNAENPQPYHSYGNGSAMRVSPVGWAFNSINEVLREAEKSAAVTHNHPEGIKGAQAVALAIFLSRTRVDKKEIKLELESRFGYNLSRKLDDIRPVYQWDVTCQGSVPESIISFMESHNFESAVRNAISLGGDADTMAAIAGSIAEAYYDRVPEDIKRKVLKLIPAELRGVIDQFNQIYSN